MRAGLAALISLTAPMFTGAEAATDLDLAKVGHIEVSIETSAAPYPQEMVLLKIRSTLFRNHIALERLEQPALENFSWVQLGRDQWSKGVLDGVQAIVCERLLALFPAKSGQLTIDAFIHHITFIGDNGARNNVDLRSAPVNIDISARTSAQGGPDSRASWWLPVKSLTITDRWEPEPDRIRSGETAHRTVTVEALGITADRLPPVPRLLSKGVITFAGAAERKTTLTPAGPVAYVTYRWDVRPATKLPAMLQAIHIPWFDTKARQMHDATIPARRIAFATADIGSAKAYSTINYFGIILSGIASFVLGSLFLIGGVSSERVSVIRCLGQFLHTRRELRDLKRAGRLGDAKAFRSAVYTLARRDPERLRRCVKAPPVNAKFDALDRYLFGSNRSELPDVRMLSDAVTRIWTRSYQEGDKSFQPLDGMY